MDKQAKVQHFTSFQLFVNKARKIIHNTMFKSSSKSP
jgi:hypothetical protein